MSRRTQQKVLAAIKAEKKPAVELVMTPSGYAAVEKPVKKPVARKPAKRNTRKKGKK